MWRCVSLILLAAFVLGCAKHDTPIATPSTHTAPDLASLGSHIQFIAAQPADDPSNKMARSVDTYWVDMPFDDAKKQIGRELLKQGWQTMDVPVEKGTRSATYMNLSKGTYSIVYPDTGSPKNCTLVYMAFKPGDVSVTKTP